MNCIKDHWDGEHWRRNHSCPQCRETFRQRPVLRKSIVLAKLVENLKKTELQAAPDDQCYAGPEDVACDVCTGRKRKALKSCLSCPASYCRNHLQPHYDAPPLKKHKLMNPSNKLVNPSKNLQENICSRHDEVMKIFCRTDQQCICYLCAMDEHKGHETVPAAAERAEKQKELQVSRQQIQQRIQDQEKDVKLLQQEVEAINASAGKAVEDSEEIFTELIRLLQKRSSDVKQQIRSQQETEVSRVQELQEKLEQKITELKKKDAELEQLSNTEDQDHIQFLLNYPSLSALSESKHSSRIKIRPLRYFKDVTAAVSELRDKLQDVLRDTWTNISPMVTEVDASRSEPEPKSRAGFLKYSTEITLDPNTAHRKLVLSEGNRKVKKMTQSTQSYPDHPERFTDYSQVLSRESLTGRCYWEVEWRGGGGGVVAVSYKNISREGGIGLDDKSWSLYCTKDGYTFYHNNIKTPVSGPVSSRLGVFLDHRAGILSFYSVSETMTLLHRVQTTFTQPLHAGVQIFFHGASAEFINFNSQQWSEVQVVQMCILVSVSLVSITIAESHCCHFFSAQRSAAVMELLCRLVCCLVGVGVSLGAAPSCFCSAMEAITAQEDFDSPQLITFLSIQGIISVIQGAYKEANAKLKNVGHHTWGRQGEEKLTQSLLRTEMAQSGVQPDSCSAKREDVACDVCTGRKRKAVKSCLSCLASYCRDHLQPHYDAPPLKKHKLVNPSKNLQENICSRHDEVMKIFCRTDQQCICYLCTMDQHKGHETVPAAAERAEKQKELQVSRQQIQQRIQDQEEEVKLLQQKVEAINASAGKAVKDSEKIFTELIRLLQKRSSDVKQQIRSQQETEVSRVKELQEKLEQKITELKRKDAELEQLSDTEDHNQFLLNYPSLSALSESTHSSRIKIRPLRYFKDVKAAVSELRDKLQDVLRDTWTNISPMVTEVDASRSEPEPKSRAGFLKYSTEITLDPNTAHRKLVLSEGNRKVKKMTQSTQSYPDHPERFINCSQVLSRESLTGRCYWEVEWGGGGGGVVAVSYKNISRAGRFRFNDKSWSLCCTKDGYTFYHNIKTPVSGPVSSRLGVFLDHRAGILSFYSVSETMTLLHRVQTTFTQPLHAGMWEEWKDQGFLSKNPQDPLLDPQAIQGIISVIQGAYKEANAKLKNVGHHTWGRQGDVACDVCTGRKRKAVKSCLSCPASYCRDHLQPHYKALPLKKHKLVNPSKNLQENICSRHDEVMKIFCRTDQQCICYLCTMDEHKGHETVPAAAERAEKQKELQVSRQQIQQRIQDQEKDVKLLQQKVEAINASAGKAVEDSEKIFTEMIRLLQKRSSDVKQQIRSQQETEVSRVQELQEKLEQKITELKRKDAELKQLSNTEDQDHIQFLLNCPSLPALSESTHSSRIKIRPLRYFKDVTAAVSDLRDKLQDVLRDTWTNISPMVTEVDVLLSEPETRAGFLKYSTEITLDPNTAHRKLVLSEGNRKVKKMTQSTQSYPDHPERFINCSQVLSRESLTGRCYWEVEWGGGGGVVAVSYKNKSREGGFGFNDKSWSLCCTKDSYIFYHNNIKTPGSGPVSSRLGVFLDHRAGILSFYSVSETMTLLHRVQTTFTQPLYAGIWPLCHGYSAEFIKLQ
ncbi:LOW QUALITY PROTEIN: uncharacterized protein FYW61_018992 [Anableps anableps]